MVKRIANFVGNLLIVALVMPCYGVSYAASIAYASVLGGWRDGAKAVHDLLKS